MWRCNTNTEKAHQLKTGFQKLWHIKIKNANPCYKLGCKKALGKPVFYRKKRSPTLKNFHQGVF
ncbi:MAG: hypothetical protein EAY75_09485 [Bacteroidetes bacterium]|nr:MAG: hypothetical protein EAY75_09485 [Bacteroidota bacterium]